MAESRFKLLEAGSSVDDELSKMKRQLTAGSDEPAKLPSDAPPPSASSPTVQLPSHRRV